MQVGSIAGHLGRRVAAITVVAAGVCVFTTGVASARPNPNTSNQWDVAFAIDGTPTGNDDTATFLQGDGVTMDNCGGPLVPNRMTCNFLNKYTLNGAAHQYDTPTTDHLNLFDEAGPDGNSFADGSFGQIVRAPASGLMSTFSLKLACKIPNGGTAPAVKAGLYKLDATQTHLESQVALVPFDFGSCPTTPSFNPSPTHFGWVPFSFQAHVDAGDSYAVLLVGSSIGGAEPAPATTAPSSIAATIPAPRVGTPVSTRLSADGSPAPTFAVTAGALPAGVTLNPTTGAITGTPVAAGAYDFTVTASNSAGTTVRRFTGTVQAAPSKPAPKPVKPSAPTALGISTGDGAAHIGFRHPARTGGRITAYQVSLDGGRHWRTAHVTRGRTGRLHILVTHLTNGTRYAVELRAVNAHGRGSATLRRVVIANAPRLGSTVPNAGSRASAHNPRRYHGPQVRTRDWATTHNGTWAHAINTLGTRQLTRGEAAGLFGRGLFAYNSARLTREGARQLRSLARHLKLAHAITCEGYTDYGGEAKHESTLSRARARTVCAALVRDGIHVRVTIRGYGGHRPVVIGGRATARAANRRAVISVTD